MKKLMLTSLILGTLTWITASCEPETAGPAMPCMNDSIWYNPYDSSGNDTNSEDTINYNSGDSTYYGGGIDTTNYGGGWGDPGDTTWYGGGADTTYWGDSTNFGG